MSIFSWLKRKSNISSTIIGAESLEDSKARIEKYNRMREEYIRFLKELPHEELLNYLIRSLAIDTTNNEGSAGIDLKHKEKKDELKADV